ncbi:hypothetical protein FF38_12096 [Lucilia cuprina]|uniref:Uncharacterized protein n=1 Tax=Lucilia cuprina TaxID=7375 RepID=A0A0L0BRT8_LUCCU|nr:hypothetical protein FF38_12096 [Lucilia cuprina]
MIPDLTYATLASEMVAIGSEPAMPVDEPANILGEAFSLTSTTSSYLHRIPSGSRQWEIYLQDLVDSKTKRSVRVKRESESVNDFLQRFPIYERH